MKTGLGVIIGKLLDLFLKKAKSGEKEQDIEIIKQKDYKKVVSFLAILFISLCFLNEIFPQLQISSWWYHQTEQMLNFMLNN